MIKEKLNRFIDSFNKFDNWIIAIGLLSIFPFLIVSLYVHPSADDFNYYNRSHEFGFFEAQRAWYVSWSGRYFSTGVLSLQFLLKQPFNVYRLIPILLIVGLFYTVYKLVHLILYPFSKKESLTFAFYLWILYVFQMPTVYEGFYWLSGAITYQLANILLLWLIFYFIKFMDSGKLTFYVIAIVLLLFLIGSNEIYMLLVDLFILTVLFYDYFQTRQLNYYLLFFVLICVIFSLVVYLSPGNVIRASTYTDQHKIVHALTKTISTALSYVAIWIPFVALTSFIYIDNLNKKRIVFVNKIMNVSPYLIVSTLFSVLFIGFFTSYWSVGKQPPIRAINSIYFIFLILVFFLIFVLLTRFNAQNKVFFQFSKEIKWSLLLLILFQIGQKNNIKTIYQELLNGEIASYDKELNQRYSLINNERNDFIIVPQLKYQPRTIFAKDITTDFYNWQNSSYSKYFAKEGIKIDTVLR